MPIVLVFLAVLAVGAVAIINAGFAISILWEWFVVPLGVKAVGISHAVGLSATAFFLRGTQTEYDNLQKDHASNIASMFLAPWLAVLVGYVAKGFM